MEATQRCKSNLVVVDTKTENRTVVERVVALAQRNRARLTITNTIKALLRQEHRPITPAAPAGGQRTVKGIS